MTGYKAFDENLCCRGFQFEGGGLNMHSVNSYQDIRTEEDEEYERDVEIEFENLVEYYAGR